MNLQELLRQLKIYQELANSNEETFQRGEARVLLRELREILAPPIEEDKYQRTEEQQQMIDDACMEELRAWAKENKHKYQGSTAEELPKKKGRQPMKSTQLPKDFEISDNVRFWWGDQDGSEAELEKEFLAFKDFHLSKGTVFKDWDAALRTWMRNSKKFNAARKSYNKPEVKSDWKDITDFDKEFKK